MIFILTVEESVGIFKDHLKREGETIPSPEKICELIELAAIDAKQVLSNIEPKEAEEMLDDYSSSHIGQLNLPDPYEEFHFNVIEEIVCGYVRIEGRSTQLDVSKIDVNNPRLLTIHTS